MVSLIGGFADVLLVIGYIGSILVSLVKFILFMPLYLVFAGVMLVATFAEMTFKKISGIETIYLNGEAFGGASSGDGKDLVYAFITDSAIQDVFWAIIGLSIVLLFVFTIVALIRAEFTIDLKGSAKGPIIGRALKSLVNLLIVPVVTIISILGTNFLTKTIYDMFGTEDVSIVTKCFHVGAYNANKARSSPFFPDMIKGNAIIESGNPFTGYSSNADLANAIDKFFIEYQDSNINYKNYTLVEACRAIDEAALDSEYLDTVFFGTPTRQITFSLFKMSQVAMYYNLFKFDWLLAIGTGVVVTWILLSVCLVLVKRVFELTILFLLAPPMTAIAPLDGGQAEKKWRGEFMKRLLAVIAPIFAYNMYFLMTPLFENISLFSGVKMAVGSTAGISTGVSLLGSYQVAISDYLFIFDLFFQLVCVIVGLSIIKGASALLSNLLGVEDLVKSGGEAAKKAVDMGKKAALGATSIAVKGAKTAIGTAKKIKAAKEARKNRRETAADREKAKSELPKAEEDMNKAKEAMDADAAAAKDADAGIAAENEAFENDAEYKRNQALVAKMDGRKKKLKGNDLRDYNKAKQAMADREKERDDKIAGFKDLKEKAAKSKDAYDEAVNTYNDRKLGISSDGKYAKLMSDTKEDGSKKTDEEIAADRREAEAYRKQFDNIDVKAAKKRAWETEFGKDAHTESFFAQKFAKGTKLGDFMDKSLFGRSMKEMLNPKDNEAYDRRWKDALTGLFGDNGGGDLWKLYFNKNARAGLYEGVPESKRRQAQVDTNINFEARANFDKATAEKKARAEEEEVIRRMMAENSTDPSFDKARYNSLYKQIESGDASPAQIKELKADIEKMEIDAGITSKARKFYDSASNPESEEGKKLAEFKEKLKADASERAMVQAEEEKKKAAAAYANTHDGKAPETKLAEASMEQLAKSIERALAGGKGLKLNKEGATIKIEGLKDTLDNVNDGIKSLADAVRELINNKPPNE